MALKILTTLPPAAPVKRVDPVLTKYGQEACGLCHREPPIAPSGICATCAGKLNTTAK